MKRQINVNKCVHICKLPWNRTKQKYENMRFVQCARDVRVTQRIVLKSTWTLVAPPHPIPSQQNLGDALGTGHPGNIT